MKKRVLLLEPNYHNKYPPMGLMKLAMYHRLQGWEVRFYKGDLKCFVAQLYAEQAIKELGKQQPKVEWRKYYDEIFNYIRVGKVVEQTPFAADFTLPFVKRWLDFSRKQYREGVFPEKLKFDRVGVTTLFTFYRDITIETIEFAKKVVKSDGQIQVGGVMASVVPDEIERSTGIRPHKGLLTAKKLFDDPPIDTPIDELPLDYSILDEVDYEYPEVNAYYGYTTRGCVNHCKFCAVPILEPKYKSYLGLKKRIKETDRIFGAQRDLLLLDNNVFASKDYHKIIREIRDCGFKKGAQYIPPDPWSITIRQLKTSWNDRAYIRRGLKHLDEYCATASSAESERIHLYRIEHHLQNEHFADKSALIKILEEVYPKRVVKRPHPLVRIVDFNQGVDARLATEDRISDLSTIAIRPLRVAFDQWTLREAYVKAISLAAKYEIMSMSNYILYNFKDKPIELYRRLLINIDLCDALGVNIYSFPMKYHPIFDKKWFSNRDYIGDEWCRKDIRCIQAVLNSTKGKVGRGRTFFFAAFGRTEDEFLELLKMPESFIIKRWDAEICGLADKWRRAYRSLSAADRKSLLSIVDKNVFKNDEWKELPEAVRSVLKFYLYDDDDIPTAKAADKERFIESFGESCTKELSVECRRLLKLSRT